jgi:hypothetical protein
VVSLGIARNVLFEQLARLSDRGQQRDPGKQFDQVKRWTDGPKLGQRDRVSHVVSSILDSYFSASGVPGKLGFGLLGWELPRDVLQHAGSHQQRGRQCARNRPGVERNPETCPDSEAPLSVSFTHGSFSFLVTRYVVRPVLR